MTRGGRGILLTAILKFQNVCLKYIFPVTLSKIRKKPKQPFNSHLLYCKRFGTASPKESSVSILLTTC